MVDSMVRMNGSPFDIDHHREVALRAASGRVGLDVITASHGALLAEVERLQEAASVTPTATLGSLVAALEAQIQDAPVFVEYLGVESNPGRTCYYRGRHVDLAIEPHGKDPKTVAELLTSLRQVLRNGVPGPDKDLPASDQTEVWIASYRDPSNQHLSGVRWDGRSVVLLTSDRGPVSVNGR